MDQEHDSEFMCKEPCPACGSQDNLARYTDGHAFCFGCDHWEPPSDGATSSQRTTKGARMDNLLSGTFTAIPARLITEDTCRKFGYHVGTYKGETVHIADYRNKDGDRVAQKIRTASKDFSTLGEFSGVALFGSHLWNGGKKLVVTEGEIDCLTVSQVQNNKWPVVSVPNGASAAKKAIQRNLSYFDKFDEVIFMFDMDDPGQEAAKECAALLPVGKAKIATLSLKDPNDLLKAGKADEIISAMWNAKDYRPDGLLTFDDVIDRIKKPVEWGIPWFDERLTLLTYGRRYKEIYTFGAGTGIGKTDWLTQQIADDMEHGRKVGLIFLETPADDLGKRIAGKKMKQLFHIPDAGWTPEQLTQGCDWLLGKGTLYDSFGQTDWDVIRGHIRYMATAQGIRIFYLDHLTALADTEDEKGSIERIMKELAGLVHELDIMLHLVSHLSTPEGKPHEEGGRVSIRHFKGSRSIGFWSNFMFGLERSQQSEDLEERAVTTFRILKDRNTGRGTGETLGFTYDRDTGHLMQKDLSEPASPFPNTGDKPDF